MSGFGDFHSTDVMFWYQQVALSGSDAYMATADRGLPISISV